MTMVQEGDRIELVHTSDEYTALEPGATGTVTGITELPPGLTGRNQPETQVDVDWDSGSSLSLIQGEDSFRKLDNDDTDP